MSEQIRQLEPRALWNHFADLNAVPRGSKKEDRVIQFMLEFGNLLGLPTSRDEIGNVIIKKPATPGYEDRPIVALQSHLDMVHQKNADTQFDFDSQGIQMLLEGDWVKAEGTTLGADNGIGVAAIMALLASKEIPHPPLEALFTIDEETGMTGAKGLAGGLLSARFMLNLDTEDDTELTIGCAGGVDVLGSGTYSTEPTPSGWSFWKVKLSGLSGGHSGMDIHLGRGNANKLMNRFLTRAAHSCQLRVAEIDGGGLRNAIPRESVALVAVPEEKALALKDLVRACAQEFAREHSATDPQLGLTISEGAAKELVSLDFQGQLLRAIYALPNGIYRMSPEVSGLVQTSSNLARVVVQDGEVKVQCLCRGSVDTEKMDMAAALRSAMELTELKVAFEGEYPGWAPNPDSAIVKLMSSLYRETFQGEPHVNACHAGLECGILGQNYPDMEMISFGPNIRGAHSPDERVQVSSVQKTWQLLTHTLERVSS